MADSGAKCGASLHPFEAAAVQRVARAREAITMVARFIGHVVAGVRTNYGSMPTGDAPTRPPISHLLEVVRPKVGAPHAICRDSAAGRYRCTACWESCGEAGYWAFARDRCSTPHGLGHSMWQCGPLVFCVRCGAYSANTAKKLLKPCTGVVVDRRRLNSIRAGKHPTSGKAIGVPTPFEHPALSAPL